MFDSLILTFSTKCLIRFFNLTLLFLGMHDGLEHSMSVDLDRRLRIESPRGQMGFFNDVPWQNIAIYI